MVIPRESEPRSKVFNKSFSSEGFDYLLWLILRDSLYNHLWFHVDEQVSQPDQEQEVLVWIHALVKRLSDYLSDKRVLCLD